MCSSDLLGAIAAKLDELRDELRELRKELRGRPGTWESLKRLVNGVNVGKASVLALLAVALVCAVAVVLDHSPTLQHIVYAELHVSTGAGDGATTPITEPK